MATHEDVTHNKGTLVHLQDDTTTNTAVKQKGTPSGAAHVTLYDSSGAEQDLVSYLIGTFTPSANVSQSTSSQNGLASNANRKFWKVYNASDAILYIDEDGGTASATNFSWAVQPWSGYEPEGMIDTGLITCVWGAAGSGIAAFSEFV